MKLKLFLTISVILAISGCVAEKDDTFLNTLKSFNNTLGSVNNTISGTNNDYSSALIPPTDKSLLSMQKDAWKNMNTILNVTACQPKGTLIDSKLRGFSSHDASINGVIPVLVKKKIS